MLILVALRLVPTRVRFPRAAPARSRPSRPQRATPTRVAIFRRNQAKLHPKRTHYGTKLPSCGAVTELECGDLRRSSSFTLPIDAVKSLHRWPVRTVVTVGPPQRLNFMWGDVGVFSLNRPGNGRGPPRQPSAQTTLLTAYANAAATSPRTTALMSSRSSSGGAGRKPATNCW
jgi:hypothetical protein